MNRAPILIILSVLVPGVCVSQLSYAETLQGQWLLNIHGNVETSSCTIEKSDITQSLGDWETRDLKTVGQTTQPVDIHVNLMGCDAGIAGTVVTISGLEDKTNPSLLGLSNAGETGTATGVGVVITDSSGAAISVNNSALDIPLSPGDNDLLFHAAYQVTKLPVTGGTANAVMYMDFAYQ